MLMKPLLATSMSGALGGVMASRHKGSAHLQLRGLRSNRGSQEQQVVRGAVAGLTAIWSSELTQLQRDGWNVYASQVPVTNRIGEQGHISGMMMFVRANVARGQIAADRINKAPSNFNRAVLTRPDQVATLTFTQRIGLNLAGVNPPDQWRFEEKSIMFVFIGRPQNSGIATLRSSYRLAGSLRGSSPFPPLFAFFDSPFPFGVGQRVFFRFEVSYSDGRYTLPTFDSVIAIAN